MFHHSLSQSVTIEDKREDMVGLTCNGLTRDWTVGIHINEPRTLHFLPNHEAIDGCNLTAILPDDHLVVALIHLSLSRASSDTANFIAAELDIC